LLSLYATVMVSPVRAVVLREFGGLDGERLEVAIRARCAVDRDFELSAQGSYDGHAVDPSGLESVAGGQCGRR
jgi:hypothetical protein